MIPVGTLAAAINRLMIVTSELLGVGDGVFMMVCLF